MKGIHKIGAIVIQDNKFLIVRKKGKDVWISLGGKPEKGETEKEALFREIREEFSCDCKIVKKLGDFSSVAAFENVPLLLSAYLVELKGEPKLAAEIEEFCFIGKDYAKQGIKVASVIEQNLIPFCVKEGLLDWQQALRFTVSGNNSRRGQRLCR